MKIMVFILGILVSAPWAVSGQTKEIPAEPGISAVTVYLNGARIFGEKKIELQSGIQTVRLTGIPSQVDPESIQVTAEGQATILSVNFESDYLSQREQTPAIKNLVNRKDQLVKATEREKTQIEILDKEMMFMQSNMKVTGTNNTTKVTELAPVYDYFVTKITEITRDRQRSSDSIQSWSEQITKLNNQIAELNASLKSPSGVVVVNLEVPARNGVVFRLNYLIRDAGWYPSYDIRVKNIESPVLITYKANVHQNSGMDWKDVKIRFSSANPSQSGILPELTPWFLRIQVPQQISIRGLSVQQSTMMKKSALAPEMDAREAAPTPPPMMTTEENGTTVEFVMEKSYSVPSSGKNLQVDVSTVSLPAEYSYLTIPKADLSAHLKARLADWEQLNLMPGEANVYFEDSFTGKTYLNTQNFTDTLDISLGIDRNIAIQRTLEKELSTTRFLASKAESMKNWKLSVRNNKSQKISITMKDQIPVTASSEIEVTDTRLSGGSLNAETGEVTWKLEVKPSEKAEKNLSYTVRYPKGKKVNLE
jgi:uncharacterized protein (TIGR02231 family)